MKSSWFLWWFLAMVALLAMPVAYGRVHRGWGPTYSGYVQRRRAPVAGANGNVANIERGAWGLGADALWTLGLISFFWLAALFGWP